MEHNNLRYFYNKKSNIDKRLSQEFLDHGIATIPCQVSCLDDIISNYSIKNYETLNPGFKEYVTSIVDSIPVKYPLVLNIVGHEFTDDEKKIIKETIEADFSYMLGKTEHEIKYHIKTFVITLIGFVIISVLLFGFSIWEGFAREFLFILFWFFSDTFIRYIFSGTYSLNREKLIAGRLACIKIYFSKEYSERSYTDEEANEIIAGLSKNS